MSNIHSSAIIEKGAYIDKNASIGPYCIIGKNVKLGNVKLMSHIHIDGDVEIGDDTIIYPFTVIGVCPQITNFNTKAKSKTIIGKNCIIREHVTIHSGSDRQNGETIIGDNCFIMVGCHIAHDCELSHHIIMANNVMLGGHVKIDEHVTFGATAAVHQYVHIGAYAMIGGGAALVRDIIPYGLVYGERAHLKGLNLVGMKRHGIEPKKVKQLKASFDSLFKNKDGSMKERAERFLLENDDTDIFSDILRFVLKPSKRGILNVHD